MAKPKNNQPPLGDYLDEILPIRKGEKEIGGLILVEPARIKTLPQARKVFNEEALTELRESIGAAHRAKDGLGETGIHVPLIVRPDPDAARGEASYFLVAGERRLRAALFLKLPLVPALISQSGTENTRLTQIVENLQREDLSPLETAEALATLKDEQKLSVRNLATMIGKGKGYVEQMLALASSGDDIKSLVSWRQDSVSIAREIEKITDPDLRATLIEAAKDGATMKEIRGAIEAATAPLSATQSTGQNSGSGFDTSSRSYEMGMEGSNSGDGSAAPASSNRPPKKIDLIADLARPAVSRLARIGKELETAKISAGLRRELRAEMELARQQIAAIEERIQK